MPNAPPKHLKLAYGGVVLNDQGHVLLREPANHFGGYVWTFAKGRTDAGETPEQAALREVLEETGHRAELVAEIPEWFVGDTTATRFYLMRSVEDTGLLDAETTRVRWVSFAEARTLVALTRSVAGRVRDLAGLDAAQTLVGALVELVDAR